MSWFTNRLPAARLRLLNILKPVTELIGNIHMPFSIKKITGEEALAAQAIMTPGMIFVVRTDGQLANIAIPGFWSHAATVSDSDHVVEATGIGVHDSNIFDFLLRRDYAVLLKPKFATPDQMKVAAQYVVDQIGAKYDYDFLAVQDTEAEIAAGDAVSQRAFYCSKLPWAAYRKACGPNVPFTTRLTLGVQTVVPADYILAVNKWEVVWASKTAKPHLVSKKN
jgi:uncharacterized protein YycO